MNWLNIRLSFLRSPEYIGSEPTARATWLNVLSYCAEQENGGRIVGARKWKDRQWQQTCGVMVAEVNDAPDLLAWDGDDLLVWNYPSEKELEIQQMRELGKSKTARKASAARLNGAKGGRPKTEQKTQREQTQDNPTETHRKEGERKKKEKEEKEGARKRAGVVDFDGLPGELDTAEFRDAWSRYLDYRRKMRHGNLLPESITSKWRMMVAWGVNAAIEQIEETMRQQWQGIFAPKTGTKVTPVSPPQPQPQPQLLPPEAFKTLQDMAAERREREEAEQRRLAGED